MARASRTSKTAIALASLNAEKRNEDNRAAILFFELIPGPCGSSRAGLRVLAG
jgi:hypothetical protein